MTSPQINEEKTFKHVHIMLKRLHNVGAYAYFHEGKIYVNESITNFDGKIISESEIALDPTMKAISEWLGY
jgi:hypothetical protein